MVASIKSQLILVWEVKDNFEILRSGAWTISALFHIGNRRPANLYYRVNNSTGGGKFDRVMVNFASSATHFPVFYFYKYCAVRSQVIISRVARRVVYKNYA